MNERRGRQRRRREGTGPTPSTGPDPLLGLRAIHFLLIAGGGVAAVAGYWLLSRGSISAAPVLLILAYLVLVPIGLALPARRRGSRDGSTDR